ncbi:MAG: CoB--CoM heterodisulfide reductase subunit B [Candidatus Methanofastidiosa archaeon]|nr:CoB--CoM heterodisulfide reductase subunit B [Candidatus Methanofastidiosa archaeon]
MEEYAFFPGCIAKNVYPGIEKATRIVFEKLGIGLRDYEYSCCPPPGVLACYDKPSWLVMGARNLSQSEKDGLNPMTVCSGCYGTLHNVWYALKNDPDLMGFVNDHLGRIDAEYKGKVHPIHFVDILKNYKEKIAELKEIDLGLNVAVHYGCHYLKPSSVTGENSERPTLLDELVGLAGCKAVPFKDGLTCCGAGGGVMSGEPDVSLKIINTKLNNMKDANVDAIVNICSFCHMQFDQSQKKLKTTEIPVLHLNQLFGLAFGIRPKHLALHTHLVSTRDLEKKLKDLKKGGE